MPDPLVVLHLRQVKAQLLAREHAQMQDMARHWLQVEQSIQMHLTALAQEIHDAGGYVSRHKLYQMDRYKAFREQARREIRKYVDYADISISSEQRQWARLGLDSANEAIQLGYYEAARVAPVFDRLDVEAVEAMAGMAGDGSPLKALLRDVYGEAVEGLTRELVKGTALGQGVVETARALRGFGMGLQKSMVIARTEQARVYRHAMVEQYRTSGVVRGFRRMSARDGRTCLACLAADGQVFSLKAEFYDHPQGRCSVIPELVGLPDVQFETAEQWIKTLPASGQRGILGDQRYDLWKAGMPFSRFAKHTHDETWGGSLTPRPLNELSKAA